MPICSAAVGICIFGADSLFRAVMTDKTVLDKKIGLCYN